MRFVRPPFSRLLTAVRIFTIVLRRPGPRLVRARGPSVPFVCPIRRLHGPVALALPLAVIDIGTPLSLPHWELDPTRVIRDA